MPLRAGDIVRLYDGTVRPQKHKLFVCVYAGDGWFFRLNSQPHWQPHFALQKATDACLDHDCFVELRGVIEYDEQAIDDSLRVPANYLGRLCDPTLLALLAAVIAVKTLTPEEKDRVKSEINAVIAPTSAPSPARAR